MSSLIRSAAAQRARIKDFVLEDFGADPSGTVDSSAALLRAWNAVLVSGVARGRVVGSGKYRLSSSVILDGNENITLTTDVGTSLDIALRTIAPDAGIGTALTLRNVRNPHLSVRVMNGGNGSASDVGVEWYNVEGMAFDIEGSNYAGVLCKYDGTQGIWLENGRGRIFARACWQAFNFSGPSTNNTGTGTIDSVWDVMPTTGSTLANMDDVTIKHYENTIVTPTFTASNSLSIVNSSAMHFGKVNLGNSGAALMVISGDTSVDIDDFYGYGGNGGGTSGTTGLQVYNSALVSIAQAVCEGLQYGVWAGGNSNVQIGNFKGLNNTNDFYIAQGPGSVSSMNLTIGDYFSQGAYAESIKAPAAISGRLQIKGGRIRTGNTGGAATAAIDTSVSGSGLLTYCDGLDIDTTYATSVKTAYRQYWHGRSNNFQGTTPMVDSTGAKGTADGRTFVMPVPALALASNTTGTQANAVNDPIALWVPMRFETTAVAGDSADLQLIDPSGTVYDLTDAVYAGSVPTAAKYFVLRAIVPAGWSWKINVSNQTNVTLQGTPRSLKL